MLAHLILPTILAVTPTTPDAGDVAWLFQGLSGVSLLGLLGLLWRVSAWHTTTDARLTHLEIVVVGDGKGSPGCALKHKALEEQLRDSPSKGSMNEAFEQLRALERAASEDRQANAVALARIEGALQALLDKIDALAGSERAPLPRKRTNPGFDSGEGR